MKRSAVIAILTLLASLTFSACAPATPAVQTPDGSNIAGDGASAEAPDHDAANAAEFLNDIGKTLSELKREHPEGKSIIQPDGFPDNAAVCFGTPDAEYLYFFFGAQSGDAEKAMNECEGRLKCAGFLTTAGTLFPGMEDDMSFQDFFSLIDVDDYAYFGEDTDTTAQGWLSFTYHGMEVMVNTNEAASDGGWNFTGAEIVKRDAPVSIVDSAIFNANRDMADAVMFDQAAS